MSIFDKLVDLKDKFAQLLGYKKKMKALENLATVRPFSPPVAKRFELLKECMKDGFLEQPAVDFLGYMVDKHFQEQNYLDWAFKTRWLKGEMKRVSNETLGISSPQMDFFSWDKEKPRPVHVPVELLASSQHSFIRKGA